MGSIYIGGGRFFLRLHRPEALSGLAKKLLLSFYFFMTQKRGKSPGQ